MIDARWTYRDHVQYIGDEADRVTAALGILMLNIRGPSMAVRKLYANVVLSIMLYAVVPWCNIFNIHRNNWTLLTKVQRIFSRWLPNDIPNIGMPAGQDTTSGYPSRGICNGI